MSRSLVRFTAAASIALLGLAAAAPPAIAGQAPAQAAPAASAAARVLTLDDALALAEVANETVLVAEAGVRKATGAIAQTRSQRLPQLTGTASYDRTLKSEFEGLFDNIGGSDGGDNSFANLPFGQPNAYRAGLVFSQLIYAGGRERALERQARLGRDSANLALTSTKAELQLDVAIAFYDAALADKLVAIAQETLDQAAQTFEQTRAKREAGLVAEFELLRAQVARDTLQPTVVRADASRDVAYLRLKQIVDLPLGTPLELAAQLDDPKLAPAQRFTARLAEAEATPATRLRNAVTQAELGLQVNQQGVVIADAQRKPAVGLQSSYGLVNYPSVFPGVDDWRTNWTLGVALQIPILTGGRIKAEQGMARADVDASKARLQLTKELADLDEAGARAELGAARAEWEASAGTIQQATRAYEIADLRYREGISTQLELSDARLLLAQAQVNRARAARDLQLTRIRLALLPELPLGGSGSTGSAQGTQGSSTNITAASTASPAAANAVGSPAAAGAQGAR
jgi:outer membrane protein TolC